MASFEYGDEVIYKFESSSYDGIVQDIFQHQSVVYFPNGGPYGRQAMLVHHSYLRHKPKWERVEGKVRITPRGGSYKSQSATEVENCIEKGSYFIERLVEDGS